MYQTYCYYGVYTVSQVPWQGCGNAQRRDRLAAVLDGAPAKLLGLHTQASDVLCFCGEDDHDTEAPLFIIHYIGRIVQPGGPVPEVKLKVSTAKTEDTKKRRDASRRTKPGLASRLQDGEMKGAKPGGHPRPSGLGSHPLGPRTSSDRDMLR